MQPSTNAAWRAAVVAATLLSAVTFTPLVTPEGVSDPELFGLPRTLWTGLIVAFALVAITFIGTRVHPGEDDDRGAA